MDILVGIAFLAVVGVFVFGVLRKDKTPPVVKDKKPVAEPVDQASGVL